jgi:hypothetical protein
MVELLDGEKASMANVRLCPGAFKISESMKDYLLATTVLPFWNQDYQDPTRKIDPLDAL